MLSMPFIQCRKCEGYRFSHFFSQALCLVLECKVSATLQSLSSLATDEVRGLRVPRRRARAFGGGDGEARRGGAGHGQPGTGRHLQVGADTTRVFPALSKCSFNVWCQRFWLVGRFFQVGADTDVSFPALSESLSKGRCQGAGWLVVVSRWALTPPCRS